MAKTCIEVCLISARGLKLTPSLFKFQWFAVAWIDPKSDKYCTRIDSSSNGNPVWKTKFSVQVETSELINYQDLAITVEVYSREPIFLRRTLFGTANIALKEFLDKYSCSNNKSEVVPNHVEEVGSFQLRRKSSNKPRGFVDVSIRISEKRHFEASSSSYTGGDEVFDIMNHSGCINLDNSGSSQSRKPESSPMLTSQKLQSSHHQMPIPPNYLYNPSTFGSNNPPRVEPSYQPPQLLPHNNIGNSPSFVPRTYNLTIPGYINTPSSMLREGQRVNGPGFGLGLGAGALAAGSVIFGSGYEVPSGLRDASLNMPANTPF